MMHNSRRSPRPQGLEGPSPTTSIAMPLTPQFERVRKKRPPRSIPPVDVVHPSRRSHSGILPQTSHRPRYVQAGVGIRSTPANQASIRSQHTLSAQQATSASRKSKGLSQHPSKQFSGESSANGFRSRIAFNSTSSQSQSYRPKVFTGDTKQSIRIRNVNIQQQRRRSNIHTPNNIEAISLATLNSLLDDSVSPLQVATELSRHHGFGARLQQNLSTEWIEVLLKVIGKMCRCEDLNPSLNKVLQILLNESFETTALKFVTELALKKNGCEQMGAYLIHCLYLMKAWLIGAPNSSDKAVSLLLPVVKDLSKKLDLDDVDNIENRIEDIEALMDVIYSSKYGNRTQARQSVAVKFATMHSEAPPDDYRTISIVPTQLDINPTEKPFVRTNLIDAAYQSTEHYLDVQFRLLREDFVRPLREGIKEYIFLGTKGRGSRTQGIKVYRDVRIKSPPVYTDKGLQHTLKFDVQPLKFVDWRNSKRLQYGNLVCLSSDFFHNHILFASVINKDKVSDGELAVEFLNMTTIIGEDQTTEDHFVSSLISAEDLQKNYEMVESEAYFEAYRHVLAGLQETTIVPLERYLVYCDKNMRPPRYVRLQPADVKYDFSSILPASHEKPYKILDTASWPSSKELGLDPSQTHALKTALTNELAIIQGPPGTGKTHVGLNIMKMLLKNQVKKTTAPIGYYNRRVQLNPGKIPSGPILVVCYTNHALDQFLEGIAKFHPTGLVRVGGRCKTESLMKYSLREIRKERRIRIKVNDRSFYEVKQDIETSITKLKKSDEIMHASSHSIIAMQLLAQLLPNQIRVQLPRDKDLLNWLALKKIKLQLPVDSFVIEETIQTCANMVAPALLSMDERFTKDFIVLTMKQTGHLLGAQFLNALNFPQQASISPENLAKNVFSLLNLWPFPNGCEVLFQRGFHPLEIKCAFMVTGFLHPQLILAWLRKKHGLAVDENLEPTQDNNFVQDEADFIQEQRMVDDDDHDDNIDLNLGLWSKISAAYAEEVAQDFGDDGFTMVEDKDKWKKKFLQKVNKDELMSKEEADKVGNIFVLTANDRWRLYRFWVSQLKQKLNNNVKKHLQEYNDLVKELANFRNEEDFSLLQDADVVAMTTSGAAKYRDMIYKLPVKIVIVEEAAEVLEAHIVTSMPKTTQHLILIGDHQQLRPSPTDYDLAENYDLKVSLFERMVKNGIPCSRLQLQHRMRPRIADLLRPHIYDDLRDHVSVEKYDHVVGLQKNIFFLSHRNQEKAVRDGMSKVNQHEADFTVTLCNYLLLQGYRPDQITILTAYVGQLLAFKKISSPSLRGVRVTAVDNFQGEENDIILLSLVRSNEEGRIGFLKVENRVCVALSRAKKGLYCIGNFQMLSKKSKLWENITKELKRDELIGDELTLQCKYHPDRTTQVKTVEDFEKFPGGGCGQVCGLELPCRHLCPRKCHRDDEEHTEYLCRMPCERLCHAGHDCKRKCHEKCCCDIPCQFRLPCGHVCDRICHQDDAEHVKFQCKKPCEESCEFGHKCSLKCFEKCKCQTKVLKVVPNCGHEQEMPCHMDPDKFQCKHSCDKLCDSGHKCQLKCSDTCKCTALIHKVMPKCGHKQEMQCHKDPSKYNCDHPCEKLCQSGHKCQLKCSEVCKCTIEILKVMPRCQHHQTLPCHLDPSDSRLCNVHCHTILRCGHVCRGTCGGCFQGRLHVKCNQKCRRMLFCGHQCQAACASECQPCKQKCELSCRHRNCKHSCGVQCSTCRNPCPWKCKHQQCTKLCGEPCNRPPCDHPCEKVLKCGHPCIGFCGEPCPKLCRTCNEDEVDKIIKDLNAKQEERFIQLENCNHAFPLTTMDKLMLKTEDMSDLQFKKCPTCKTPITRSTRYGRVVNQNRSLINIIKKKFAANQLKMTSVMRRKTIISGPAFSPRLDDWYRCENGHVCFKTNSTQSQTCPDCKIPDKKKQSLQLNSSRILHSSMTQQYQATTSFNLNQPSQFGPSMLTNQHPKYQAVFDAWSKWMPQGFFGYSMEK
ncbi:unnamed protein product [Clavelina lepadiformis]|uniref:NF-X1-type domain-containing protein n=1 Tax=Clavelina lepadiformis TaxID=159417 RepID=A0ABP0FMP3_CLALP